MGAFLSLESRQFDGLILGLSLLTAILLQLVSNFANDAGDAINGADHVKREGPSRLVQDGLLSIKEMKKAIWITGILSFCSGLALIYFALETKQDLLIFLSLGLFSIIGAIGYTMGKRPYGYFGLGDISVLIFFGWIGVIGSYYLQTHSFNSLIILPATTCGLFAVAVLNVNNIRDIDSDKLAGKNTLAAQLGHRNARIYQILLVTIGLILMVVYTFLSDGSWLFLLVTPFLSFNAYQTVVRKSADKLDPLVRQMALSSLIFVLLFGIGIFL
jgi:1,4-dihydroxy-2-naphthoate octaprenyltransferase